MSRREEKDSSRTPHPSGPSEPGGPSEPITHPNAFAPELFDELRRRDPHPATPAGDFAGPWRVQRLWGDGPPLWACYGAGERGPRLTYQEPDLAFLGATGLALAERPPRFRFQRGADGRLHLMHDGYPVATVADSVPEGCSLPADLTRLADLRVQPQALAHLLVAVPDEVLERAGAILMQLLRDARR